MPKECSTYIHWKEPRAMRQEVIDVVSAMAGLATVDGDTSARVRAKHVRRELQVQEVRFRRAAIRRIGSSSRPNGKDFEGTGPRQGELGLEHLLVRIIAGFLADGTAVM